MIALYDHIQELRAELRLSILSRRARAETENELARAIAEHDALERDLDDIFEIPPDDV
jgi:hypothetical protein